MKLVLLPGMDGTGELFAPFVREFGAAAQVVRYPTSQPLGYAELEAIVRRELPAREGFVLLGESFSGPIAIAIAADPPANFKGLVLCCTFARAPHPQFVPLKPLIPIFPAPPFRLVEALLCGRFASAEIRALLAHALAQVPLRVLKARVRAIAEVDVRDKLRAIHQPVLYLKATEDRVIPSSALRKILERAPGVQVVDLVAPHFLLQTVPKEAAAVIGAFMERVSHATAPAPDEDARTP